MSCHGLFPELLIPQIQGDLKLYFQQFKAAARGRLLEDPFLEFVRLCHM